MTTGYNIHEGSVELARRRQAAEAVTDHDREVASAMLRRFTLQQLWQTALLVLLEDEPCVPSRGSFHPESLRA